MWTIRSLALVFSELPKLRRTSHDRIFVKEKNTCQLCGIFFGGGTFIETAATRHAMINGNMMSSSDFMRPLMCPTESVCFFCGSYDQFDSGWWFEMFFYVDLDPWGNDPI